MEKEYIICMNKKEKAFYSHEYGTTRGVGINNARRCTLEELGYAKNDVQRLGYVFMKFNDDGKLVDIPFSSVQNR